MPTTVPPPPGKLVAMLAHSIARAPGPGYRTGGTPGAQPHAPAPPDPAGAAAAVVYEPRRSAAEADRALRLSLHALDHARSCSVLWFADIMDRRLFADLGHPTIEVYARQALGFSANRTRQFIGLACRLRRMPRLKAAVVAGRVGWSTALEVSRMITPASEEHWVGRACTLSRAELREEMARVKDAARRARAALHQAPAAGPMPAPGSSADPAHCPDSANSAASPQPGARNGQARLFGGAGGAASDGSAAGAGAAPIGPVPSTPDLCPPITIAVQLDPLQYARFEALAEAARKSGRVAATAGRAELKLAAMAALVAPEAHAAPASGADTDSPQPARRRDRKPGPPAAHVIVQRCPDCEAAFVQTGLGPRRLQRTVGEALRCDAVERDERGYNRATIPPAVRRQVLDRDGHRCTTPGCSASRFLEVHHVIARRAGGSNRPQNLVTLCHRCHRAAHEANGQPG